VIICEPTPSSNVISPTSLTTILRGLTSGFICMFEVLFGVYCVFGSRMIIQVNSVFTLFGGSISMKFIDCMDVCWFGVVGACIAWEGALDNWTLSSNNGMFGFASPFTSPWTY
jgi:hypothetical protein